METSYLDDCCQCIQSALKSSNIRHIWSYSWTVPVEYPVDCWVKYPVKEFITSCVKSCVKPCVKVSFQVLRQVFLPSRILPELCVTHCGHKTCGALPPPPLNAVQQLTLPPLSVAMTVCASSSLPSAFTYSTFQRNTDGKSRRNTQEEPPNLS